ncbi:capsular polysaccharide biosynthesis glycosyltransferase CapM [Holospora obtusa F1]|uniref:Capsular polysaccharide biosynthesis glycosyltransferase CapM n=1 Tax=Holospora obtusa F1 TaxID=1399147 RepID=W6TI68_HOLOB|nr:glycosyltransferase [Holospora obtusa]ETZ07705.1 capsular polysaccharide biosynthesis glycosyltransferase CapM [Holospora obtusa F1]
MNTSSDRLIEKPKIVYVVPVLDIGGCEMHLLSVLPALQKWFSIRILIFHHHAGALGPLFEAQGIDLVCLLSPTSNQYGRIRRWIQGTWRLRKHLSTKVDILHAFLPIAYCSSGVAYLLSRKVKHFLMSRRALNIYAQNRYILRKLEKFLHKHLCLALGNSSEVCKQLEEEGIPPEKVYKIFNGLPLRPLYSLQEKETILQKIQDVPLGWIRIVYVANFMSYKGHEDLVAVSKTLLSLGHSHFCFLLAGRDSEDRATRLKNRITQQGIEKHFRFLGEVYDPRTLLNCADMGVFPSHEEGFSNGLLEKMAQGLAVVAVDVGGNRDAIISGKNGYLIPLGDTQAMAQSLALLISNPVLRTKIGNAAKQTVETLFTLERCVDAYRIMYQKILSSCTHHG